MKNMNKFFVGLASVVLLAGCGTTNPDSSSTSTGTGTTPGGDTTSTTVDHAHNFEMQHDESEHWEVCTCGEERNREDHIMTDEVTKAPTCTEEGVKTFSCEKCDYSFTRTIEAKGHTFDEGVVTTPPSAVEPGVKTFTCLDCGFTREEAIEPNCAITLDTVETLEGYSSIYRIDIKAESLTFETSIPVSEGAYRVNLAVKVVDGGTGVFYQPVIGGHEFQWITNVENTGGWANIYGTWYKGEGTLEADGSLKVRMNDYEQRVFPAGAKIYVAVELVPYVLSEHPEKVYKEGYKTFGMEVIQETEGFVAKIPFANAGDEIEGAFTAEAGTTWIVVHAGSIGYEQRKFFRPEFEEGVDWWEPYGRWNRYTDTVAEDGTLTVTVKMEDVKLTKGTMVYVALRTRSNKMIHHGEGMIPTQWWINGVYRYNPNTYDDFYGKPSNGVGVDLNQVLESDRAFMTEEGDSCMEITYDGTNRNIEYFYFPNVQVHLRGATKVVFYVMTPDEAANEISVYVNPNAPKTVVPSLTPNQWTRVCVDLADPDVKAQDGKHYLTADDLSAFFFGFDIQGKAQEQAKFYVSSIYGIQ